LAHAREKDIPTEAEQSLKTRDKHHAQRLVDAMNEAERVAGIRKQVGLIYPQRYAQQALGHASKAVTEAYAADAQFVLPSLEEYEARQSRSSRPAVTGALTVSDTSGCKQLGQQPASKVVDMKAATFALN
jgi:hypothetical protein